MRTIGWGPRKTEGFMGQNENPFEPTTLINCVGKQQQSKRTLRKIHTAHHLMYCQTANALMEGL
jgi:superoxide dismutase